MKESLADSLIYCTIRIECLLENGLTSTGTGFFYGFMIQSEPATDTIALITNKHVIAGAQIGRLTFTKVNNDDPKNDREHFTISIDNFESRWIGHPDDDIDLCLLLLGPVLNSLPEPPRLVYGSFIAKDIPTQMRILELSAIEEIIMIGYPNGIWDSVNNKPIVRKGITAISLKLDYMGQKKFLIDAACFPGSSGSPVFIYSETYAPGNATFPDKYELLLIGVLYAGTQHTISGEIEIIEVPTVQKPVAISAIPNNLGVCIKSESIQELVNHVNELVIKSNIPIASLNF